MSTLSFNTVTPALLETLAEIAGSEHLILAEEKVEKLSKDFYWYSPVLKRQLEDKRAAAVVKISELAVLKKVVAACYEAEVPLIIRGAATGNYGQIVPLHGGIMLDLGGMDTIHEITADGVVRCDPGARLGTVMKEARAVGWEMRCYPSTWVKSTMAGFFCGGSGGIGSITWGGITANDNVKSISILTVEAEPQVLKLEEATASEVFHTYGTSGIVVEMEMRLGPKRAYQQIAVQSESWDTLIDWTDALARDPAIQKSLVTQFQAGVVQYFKPMLKFMDGALATSFLLIEQSQAEEVVASAEAAGLTVPFNRELPDPMKPPYLSDYTWNHTTLWALKADPTITYLQIGNTADFRGDFKKVWAKFPDEVLFHIEWTAQDMPVDDAGNRLPVSSDRINVGGIPLIKFKSEERLQEIIDFMESEGIGVANPHTFVLEEMGRPALLSEKVAWARKVDPKGLLNPGKFAALTDTPVSRTEPALVGGSQG